MSKTRRINHRRGNRGVRKADRHITVTSERRDPPDLRKLSRAVIALAMAEAALSRLASETAAADSVAGSASAANTDNASEEGRS